MSRTPPLSDAEKSNHAALLVGGLIIVLILVVSVLVKVLPNGIRPSGSDAGPLRTVIAGQIRWELSAFEVTERENGLQVAIEIAGARATSRYLDAEYESDRYVALCGAALTDFTRDGGQRNRVTQVSIRYQISGPTTSRRAIVVPVKDGACISAFALEPERDMKDKRGGVVKVYIAAGFEWTATKVTWSQSSNGSELHLDIGETKSLGSGGGLTYERQLWPLCDIVLSDLPNKDGAEQSRGEIALVSFRVMLDAGSTPPKWASPLYFEVENGACKRPMRLLSSRPAP